MIFIDYQPSQISAISSMDLSLLVDSVVRVAQTRESIRSSDSLVHDQCEGWSKANRPPLKQVLSDQKEYDRTTINAWEDKEFLEAVEATERKKLIMCGLWTEACLIYEVNLNTIAEGVNIE